jgi:hypothetical protein
LGWAVKLIAAVMLLTTFAAFQANQAAEFNLKKLFTNNNY